MISRNDLKKKTKTVLRRRRYKNRMKNRMVSLNSRLKFSALWGAFRAPDISIDFRRAFTLTPPPTFHLDRSPTRLLFMSDRQSQISSVIYDNCTAAPPPPPPGYDTPSCCYGNIKIFFPTSVKAFH